MLIENSGFHHLTKDVDEIEIMASHITIDLNNKQIKSIKCQNKEEITIRNGSADSIKCYKVIDLRLTNINILGHLEFDDCQLSLKNCKLKGLIKGNNSLLATDFIASKKIIIY